MYGYQVFFSPIEPASIIGNKGSTHGASMVSIQARRETSASEVINTFSKVIHAE